MMANLKYFNIHGIIGTLLMLLPSCAGYIPSSPSYIFTMGTRICSYKPKSTPYPSINQTENCFLRGPSNSHIRLEMTLTRNALLIVHRGTIEQFILSPSYTEARKKHKTFILRNSAVILDVAVDWVSGNIYYVHNDTKETINIMDIDGNYSITIHQNVSGVSGLAVAPLSRYLFWTVQYNASGTISRSGLDGSSKENLLYTNVESPGKICVDHLEKRIYWTDDDRGSIESTDFNGNNHKMILQDTAYRPVSVAIAENYVAWVNIVDLSRYKFQIYWTSKITGSHDRLTKNYTSRSLPDIINYSEYSQPRRRTNACSGKNNGECPQLCLPTSSNGRTCQCSLGYQLDNDRKTCQPAMKLVNYRNALFISDAGRGRIFVMDTANEFMISPLPLPREQDLITIAVDPLEGTVFWTERFQYGIYKGSIEDGTVETVATMKDHNIHGLAIDYTRQLIFFADYTSGWTESMSYDGKLLGTVLKENHTLSIAADIVNKKLYMAIYKPDPQIVSLSYTGSDYKVLVKSGLSRPTHLTIDVEAGKVYWANDDTIETANFDGTSRSVIYSATSASHGSLAVLGDYLYIVEKSNDNQVNRIHLKSNASELEGVGTDEFLYITSITADPGYKGYLKIKARPTHSDDNGSRINMAAIIATVVTVVVLVLILVLVGLLLRSKSSRKIPLVEEPTVSFTNPGYGDLAASRPKSDENANVNVHITNAEEGGPLPEKQVPITDESSNSGFYEKLKH